MANFDMLKQMGQFNAGRMQMGGTGRGKNSTVSVGETRDPEWTVLMMEAKKIGLTVEEIRQFLRRQHSFEKADSY